MSSALPLDHRVVLTVLQGPETQRREPDSNRRLMTVSHYQLIGIRAISHEAGVIDSGWGYRSGCVCQFRHLRVVCCKGTVDPQYGGKDSNLQWLPDRL